MAYPIVDFPKMEYHLERTGAGMGEEDFWRSCCWPVVDAVARVARRARRVRFLARVLNNMVDRRGYCREGNGTLWREN